MADHERQLIGISKIARQKVIERLKHAYASDQLDELDFESRLDLATNTQNRVILRELVEDLPEPEDSFPVPEDRPEIPSRINRGPVKPSDTFVSFFSGVSRKGDWRPARRLKAVAILGGIDLDFSETTVPPEGIDLDLFCVLGGIELRVPPGINVDARPLAIMGGIDTHGLGGGDPKAPTIRVRGLVLMGGVDVKPPRRNYLKKFLKKMFTDN